MRGGRPGTLVHVSGSCCPNTGFPHIVVGMVVGLGFTHADMVRRIYIFLMKVVHYDEF